MRRNFYQRRLVDDEHRLRAKSSSSAKATDTQNQSQDKNAKSADGDPAAQEPVDDGVGEPPPGGATRGVVDASADTSKNGSTGGGEADGAGEASKHESDPNPAVGDETAVDMDAVDAADRGDGTTGGGDPITGSNDGAPEPKKPADDPPVNNTPVDDLLVDKQAANEPPPDKMPVDNQANDDLPTNEQVGGKTRVDQAPLDFPSPNWGRVSAKSGDQASTRSSHHIHGKKKKRKRKTQSVRDV